MIRRVELYVRRALFVLVAVAMGVALAACNRPLDEDQCKRLVDKMVDLVATGQPPGDRVEKVKTEVKGDKLTMQNVKDSCVGKMTKSQYECVMAAKTFEDATACDAK